MWIKIIVDYKKWVIYSTFASSDENDKERLVFWEQLGECVSHFDE